MVWPTLGSRTAKEQEQVLGFYGYRFSIFVFCKALWGRGAGAMAHKKIGSMAARKEYASFSASKTFKHKNRIFPLVTTCKLTCRPYTVS